MTRYTRVGTRTNHRLRSSGSCGHTADYRNLRSMLSFALRCRTTCGLPQVERAGCCVGKLAGWRQSSRQPQNVKADHGWMQTHQDVSTCDFACSPGWALKSEASGSILDSNSFQTVNFRQGTFASVICLDLGLGMCKSHVSATPWTIPETLIRRGRCRSAWCGSEATEDAIESTRGDCRARQVLKRQQRSIATMIRKSQASVLQGATSYVVCLQMFAISRCRETQRGK